MLLFLRLLVINSLLLHLGRIRLNDGELSAERWGYSKLCWLGRYLSLSFLLINQGLGLYDVYQGLLRPELVLLNVLLHIQVDLLAFVCW